MNIGISTGCLYPMLVEESIEILADNGFDLFELFLNCEYEFSDEYVDIINEITARRNVRLKSIHFYLAAVEGLLLFSEYERRTAEGFKQYERYFRAIAKMGAEYGILHGVKAGAISNDKYFERYLRLSRLAKECGITLLLENVNQFCSQSPEFLKSIRNALGEDVSFNFDLKQAVRAGYNPYDILEAMGDRLKNIHINDFDENHTCLLPGNGIFDYLKFMQYLKQTQYKGDMLIEVYNYNYSNIGELKASREILLSKI